MVHEHCRVRCAGVTTDGAAARPFRRVRRRLLASMRHRRSRSQAENKSATFRILNMCN